ncbi:hypothetical protein Kpho01_25600 [Kitasatospora phosalacinea]|uniref:Uncharacterized protein n=1 Tax=Kitasatospora phosalacinea TaxID=2065 RepID=A0A9W6PEL4_9ACTN|nr:hypothetical protein Kpho01_25600 [Kitasatospora phosalacinea]
MHFVPDAFGVLDDFAGVLPPVVGVADAPAAGEAALGAVGEAALDEAGADALLRDGAGSLSSQAVSDRQAATATRAIAGNFRTRMVLFFRVERPARGERVHREPKALLPETRLPQLLPGFRPYGVPVPQQTRCPAAPARCLPSG